MADTPTMEVRARLTADSAQFVQGMNNATAAANQLTSTASRVNQAMTGISIAAAAGMGGLIALGVQSFMAAARVQELDIAINAVGKSTGLGYDAINAAAHGIKDMGIEMAVAQRSALMFAQNNLKLADASKLARTAQDLAVLSGKNSTEEFQLLTYAVMTQRSELFKSAGVNGSVQGAYQKMAQTLGISTKQLTAAQKVQAAMNMALEEGAKVAGTYEAAMTSPGKVLRSFARLNDNLLVAVGDALLKGIGPMIVGFYNFEKSIVKVMEGTGAFHDVITALTAVMVHIFTPITNFVTGLTSIVENMDKAKINVDGLAQKLNAILPILLAVGAGFATAGGAAIFKMVPVLGTILGALNPVGVGLTVLALTSSKVRDAFINLGKALLPVIEVAKKVGFTILNVMGYAVGAVSKIINGLTVVVSAAIGFITRYSGVFKALGIFLAAFAGTVVLVRTGIAALTAIKAAWAFITGIVEIAQASLSGVMFAEMGVVDGLTGSVVALDAAFGVLTLPIIGVIAAVVAAAGAIIYFYNTNETARKLITMVFNAIVHTIGEALARVVEFIGTVLQAIGAFIDSQKMLARIVATIFDFIVRFIGGAINFVLVIFANMLKGIATLIHWFGIAKEFIADVWSVIVKVIASAWDAIGGVINAVGNGISKFIQFVKNGIASLIDFITPAASAIDKVLHTGLADGLRSASAALRGASGSAEVMSTVLTDGAKIAADYGKKNTDVLTASGIKLAELTKSWGNYTSGAEGALSTVANALATAGESIVKFAGNVDGLKAIDAISNGASKAGNFIVGLASGIRSMTSGDILGNMIDGTQELVASLKETVGFGDILDSLKKKFEGNPANPNSTAADALGKNTAADIKNKADQMQKIRDAMTAGLDSIRKVMDDLQQAAKDFANSLKDTIVGFAGLKGVELPDGFIPQAKSLIENMQMKLNKATQFSSQIAQLQAMNLDAGALKQIIEAGPIQGAQLAASILGGGQEAVDQVSSLQKAIEFAGATIGNQGMVAAGYPAMIDKAQAKYNSIASADLAVGGKGTTVNITEGAFKISIDTSKATTPDEATQIVTDAINNAFATLGKELAAK
jgi:hypothetical protein